jgi:site-specific DNA recombinase
MKNGGSRVKHRDAHNSMRLEKKLRGRGERRDTPGGRGVNREYRGWLEGRPGLRHPAGGYLGDRPRKRAHRPKGGQFPGTRQPSGSVGHLAGAPAPSVASDLVMQRLRYMTDPNWRSLAAACLIQVESECFVDYSPLRARVICSKSLQPLSGAGAHSEQHPRIITDPLGFTLLTQSFRWAPKARLVGSIHRSIMCYHKVLDLCYHKCYALRMGAIGYARVSTDKQADFGVSLEVQTEKIRAMAVVQGVEICEMIVDAGESAKSLNRPGMERLLALVDSGAVDTVVIAKLDRITRSVADLAELLKRFERRGVSLVSVADSLDTRSAAGRLVLNIMVSVSQWEREAIGERTRDAMRHMRASGERVGTIPFGYQVGADRVRLEPNTAEQSILARMRELKAAGFTTRQIASELNRQGFTTRRGTAWRFQYAADALKAA